MYVLLILQFILFFASFEENVIKGQQSWKLK